MTGNNSATGPVRCQVHLLWAGMKPEVGPVAG